jgi:hypothetical protein
MNGAAFPGETDLSLMADGPFDAVAVRIIGMTGQ